MLTYVFPGQGSQFRGMGIELLDDFKTLTNSASDILGYSIRDLCIEDPHYQLSHTQYTQPAIYVVSVLSYLKHYEETSRKSDFLAGHSLGEYSALFAAGVFDFVTGLRLVKKRGELMALSRSGTMAAVLGLRIAEIENILADSGGDSIDIANLNSPEQVVLSGPRDDILALAPVFERFNASYIPLPVSAAFHSRYMREMRDQFATFLDDIFLEPTKIPVISNVHARPYTTGREKEYLCDQITSAVRWTDSIDYLLNTGVTQFKELGPGDVLTKLIEYIKQRCSSFCPL